MKLTRSVIVVLCSAALVAVAALAWRWAGARDVAPAVSYTLLDGSKGHSDQWRGKVVLVNFWATTCAICVAEMPQVVATHQRFKARGFDTLAVAMSYDPPVLVANYAESRRLPFGVVIDNTGAIAKGFGDVQLTPTTFVINQRGEIVKRCVGAPDFAALNALIDKLLKAG